MAFRSKESDGERKLLPNRTPYPNPEFIEQTWVAIIT